MTKSETGRDRHIFFKPTLTSTVPARVATIVAPPLELLAFRLFSVAIICSLTYSCLFVCLLCSRNTRTCERFIRRSLGFGRLCVCTQKGVPRNRATIPEDTVFFPGLFFLSSNHPCMPRQRSAGVATATFTPPTQAHDDHLRFDLRVVV